MKAIEMINYLKKLPPNENICVLWWLRPREENLGATISVKDWRTICDEFDEFIATNGTEIGEWMEQAITDYMKPIE